MASFQTAVALLVLAAAVPAALASCNGFDVTQQSITSCPGSIIEFGNTKFALRELNGKCHIVVNGPVYINRDFNSAKVTMNLFRGPTRLISQKHDLCNTDDHIGARLAGMGLTCPMKKGEINLAPINISEFAGMLQMARGKWTLTANARHDEGKSCVKADFTIGK